MTDCIKYPRTVHLPWSPGLQNDDRVIKSLDGLIGCEVVVTEKMDGENTTLYNDTLHARSIDGRYHASRDWIKRFWAENVAYRMDGFQHGRICGENMYAQHSIRYDDLDSYFYGFSFWNQNKCLSWDLTLCLFKDFNITPVRTLWRGKFSEAAMHDIEADMDFNQQEGYVVRCVDEFEMQQFPNVVAKFVRPSHVQTDEHWMHKEIIPNGLADGN